MLHLIYFQFLFSISSMMRCHPSEAFASARVAIDGAVIAALLIHDPISHTAYRERRKPFDKPIRHLRNLVRDGKTPHSRIITELLEDYDQFSRSHSHADIEKLRDRLELLDLDGGFTYNFHFFQIAKHEEMTSLQYLRIANTYLMISLIFSDYLLSKCIVNADWMDGIVKIGKSLQYSYNNLIDLYKEKYEAQSD